jgi:hypothetical protein
MAGRIIQASIGLMNKRSMMMGRNARTVVIARMIIALLALTALTSIIVSCHEASTRRICRSAPIHGLVSSPILIRANMLSEVKNLNSKGSASATSNVGSVWRSPIWLSAKITTKRKVCGDAAHDRAGEKMTRMQLRANAKTPKQRDAAR